MANPPRRPTNPRDAAEAAFKPKTQPAERVREAPSVPGARELVSLRIDRAVLEHFQAEGAGWQDRINDCLRRAVAERATGDAPAND